MSIPYTDPALTLLNQTQCNPCHSIVQKLYLAENNRFKEFSEDGLAFEVAQALYLFWQ